MHAALLVPKLKMSERASNGRPHAYSGEMHAAVPSTAPSVVQVESISDSTVIFASPKSSSFAPLSVTRSLTA